MSPTIHCIRHGQGFHNLGAGFYDIRDATLTPTGEQQCIALRERHFPDQSHISLIVTSPLSRAIQSASLIFQPALKSTTSPKRLLAVPDAQEISDSACDIGSDPEVLKQIVKDNDWSVDLSLIKDGWNSKEIGTRYSPSTIAIANRARDLRIYLRKIIRNLVDAGNPDPHIVLVAHGGFFHYFTGDWENADKLPGTGWTHCETRAYTFEHDINSDGDTEASLVEKSESRLRRGLSHPMFSKDKQLELFEKAMQGWEDQGLQNHSKVAQTDQSDEPETGSHERISIPMCVAVEA